MLSRDVSRALARLRVRDASRALDVMLSRDASKAVSRALARLRVRDASRASDVVHSRDLALASELLRRPDLRPDRVVRFRPDRRQILRLVLRPVALLKLARRLAPDVLRRRLDLRPAPAPVSESLLKQEQDVLRRRPLLRQAPVALSRLARRQVPVAFLRPDRVVHFRPDLRQAPVALSRLARRQVPVSVLRPDRDNKLGKAKHLRLKACSFTKNSRIPAIRGFFI